jgi:hypothetical protein
MDVRNPIKHAARWFHRWVESSLEHQFDVDYAAVIPRMKVSRRHRKTLLSPSKRLVWGTELAILVFLCLVFLQALSIVYLREFRSELMYAMFIILSFLAGTYWGHRG